MSISFEGWGGGCGSQIGKAPTDEALAAGTLRFRAQVTRCPEINPEHLMPNLSAQKRFITLFVSYIWQQCLNVKAWEACPLSFAVLIQVKFKKF